MDLSHQFTVPVSVDETWSAFNDLERVAPCFPGATLTSVDGDSFSGSVKVKLGPISMQYSGTGIWKERDESAKRAVIEARGKDKRGNGTASATVTAQLTPDGSGTSVSVVTDLAVTGKPAQFGRGVMQDVSDKLLGQFVACLSDQLGGAGDEEAAAVEPVAAASTEPVSTEPVSTEPVPTGPGVVDSEEPVETPDVAVASSPAWTTPPAEVELNLMSTILPVLARRYAAPAAGVVSALLVLRYLRRR